MVKFLTIRQAAAELKRCRNTVRKMIDDGRLRAVDLAGPGAHKPTWRVDAESVRVFQENPMGLILEENVLALQEEPLWPGVLEKMIWDWKLTRKLGL